MRTDDLTFLLEDRRVLEEVHKHLWIESQKAGYSIGIERATDEWLRLHAEGWLKYHMPEKYVKLKQKIITKIAKQKLKKNGRKLSLDRR